MSEKTMENKKIGKQAQKRLDEIPLKRDFLVALRASKGIIEAACNVVGIGRKKYEYWCKSDEEFAAEAHYINEAQIDWVESKLLNGIEAGDTTAIIFYLKTKGKHRGWTEKPLPEKKPKDENEESADNDHSKEYRRKLNSKKTYIIRLLKKEGKYSSELSMMVGEVANTYVQLEELRAEMSRGDYKKVNVQVSREGNERYQLNPIETRYTELSRLLTKQLTAIGMTTESKERRSDNDNFSEFMSKLREEGDGKPQ